MDFNPTEKVRALHEHLVDFMKRGVFPNEQVMRRVPWASEAFNCSAADTGNEGGDA